MDTTDLTTQEEQFVAGYREAILWAGSDWHGMVDDNPDPLDDNYGDDDWTDEAKAEMAAECLDFIRGNRADLVLAHTLRTDAAGDPYEGWAWLGHDFALTRNGHGAGFWDRGIGDVGRRLTDACRPYGETNEWADGEHLHAS